MNQDEARNYLELASPADGRSLAASPLHFSPYISLQPSQEQQHLISAYPPLSSHADIAAADLDTLLREISLPCSLTGRESPPVAPPRSINPAQPIAQAPAPTGDRDGTSPISKEPEWTNEEDDALLAAMRRNGSENWKMVAARVPGRDVAQVERRGRQLLGSDWNGPLQNDLGSTAAQAPRFGHVLPPPRRPLTAMEMLLQVSAPHPSPRARSIRDLLEPSSIRVPPVLPPARIPQAASGSNRPPRTTPRAKRGRGTGHDTPESELSDVSDDPSVVVECISDRDNDGELSADSQEVDIGSAAQVAHIAGPLPKTIVLAPLPTALLLPQRRRFKSSLLDPLSPPPASRNHAAATAAAAAEPPRSRPIFPPLPPPPIPLLPIKSKPPARQRRVSEPNKPAGRKRRAVLVASSDENDDEMEHDSGTSQDDHSDRPLPRTVSKRRRTLSTQSHLTESTHHHAPMDVNPPSTVLDPFMLIPLQDELDPPPLRVTVDPIPLALVDFHSHLLPTEIIGLLGGTVDASTRTINVRAVFPCDSAAHASSMQCEMDPVQETVAREAFGRLGLIVVGWYHSHPTFDAIPSVRDVENQAMYQRLFADDPKSSTPFSPWIGAICSPYHLSRPTHVSDLVFYYVGGEHQDTPYRLNYTVEREITEPESIKQHANLFRPFHQAEGINHLLREYRGIAKVTKLKGSMHAHSMVDCSSFVDEFFEQAFGPEWQTSPSDDAGDEVDI